MEFSHVLPAEAELGSIHEYQVSLVTVTRLGDFIVTGADVSPDVIKPDKRHCIVRSATEDEILAWWRKKGERPPWLLTTPLAEGNAANLGLRIFRQRLRVPAHPCWMAVADRGSDPRTRPFNTPEEGIAHFSTQGVTAIWIWWEDSLGKLVYSYSLKYAK
jgi:hypothetical protein